MPKQYFYALCALGLVLWSISVGQDICIYGFSCASKMRIIGLLDVEAEKSFYTWYSVSLLFVTGLMAFRQADAIGRNGPHHWRWLLISVIFVYLSADESLTAHEKLAKLGAMIVRPEGFFRYAWVVPAMALVVVTVLPLLALVRDLPRRERLLTVASGLFYVGGAVGMEMIDGKISEIWGEETIPYQVINSLEEAMEVIGVLIFIHVLMSLERLRQGAAVKAQPGDGSIPAGPVQS